VMYVSVCVRCVCLSVRECGWVGVGVGVAMPMGVGVNVWVLPEDE